MFRYNYKDLQAIIAKEDMRPKKPESIFSKLERINNSDARQNSPEDLKRMRVAAVDLYKGGVAVDTIAQALRVHKNTVYRWCRSEKIVGPTSLDGKVRGRKPGTHRKLSKEQRSALAAAIREKTPDQLGLPYYLWSTAALNLYMSQLVETPINPQMARRFLSQIGYRVTRPDRYYEKRNAKKFSIWRRREFPAISAQARNENAQIQWGYTIKIQPTSSVTETIDPTPTETAFVMLSASKQGAFRIQTLGKKPCADTFIDFLDRLHKEIGCKLFYFHCRFRISDRYKLSEWLKENQSTVKMFSLPL